MSSLINKVKSALSGHHDEQTDNQTSHSSNTANRLDPKIDSDGDGRAGIERKHGSSTTGYDDSSTTGNKYTSADTSEGAAFTSGTSGTGNYGSSTTATTSGPHSSGLANRADPRVDSDRDGSRMVGGTTGAGYTSGTGIGSGTGMGSGTGLSSGTGTTGVGSAPGGSMFHDVVTVGGAGSTATSGIGGYGSTATGPHSSGMANRLDPRVDSDRDGSRTVGTGSSGGALTGRYNDPSISSTGGVSSGTSGLRSGEGALDNRFGQDSLTSGSSAISSGTGHHHGHHHGTTGLGDSTGTTGGALTGRYDDPSISSNTGGLTGMGSGSGGLRSAEGALENRYNQDSSSGAGITGSSHHHGHHHGAGTGTTSSGGALTDRYTNDPSLSSNVGGSAASGSRTGALENRYGDSSLGSGTGAISSTGHHGHHHDQRTTGLGDSTGTAGGALTDRYGADPSISSNTGSTTGMGSGSSGLRSGEGALENRFGQDTLSSGSGLTSSGTGHHGHHHGQHTTGLGDSTGTTGGALSGRFGNDPSISSDTSRSTGMGSGASGLRSGEGALENRYGQGSGTGSSAISGGNTSNLADRTSEGSRFRDPYSSSGTTGNTSSSGNTSSGNTGSDNYGSKMPGSGNAPTTAGPWSSDMMNKLDPRVDSDVSGGKTYGGNSTNQ